MLKRAVIILVMMFGACMQAQTVKIAAAANLRFVLDEIKAKYLVLNPRAAIVVNLGASGVLAQQITNGADFDLFMAADKAFPEKLKAAGLVQGDVTTYAYGTLVIWSNTMDVSSGMNALTGSGVHRIAVANPALAPYGESAIQCLRYYHLYDVVSSKIVYAENISQAAQFARTGNAEVGFLALSLVVTPEMKGSYFIPDQKSYKPVEQALVLIKDPKSNPEAVKFVKFVMGGDCSSIFAKYGFILPGS